MSSSYTRSLEGRRAVITGGSNGIGRAIVAAYVQEGMHVLFTYRNHRSDADSLCDELRKAKGTVEYIRSDFEKEKCVAELVEAAHRRLGPVDVLVNNVGTLNRTSFLETSEEEYDRVLTVNLRVPFFLTQRFASHMHQSGVKGCVLNISSLSARRCRSRVAHYQVSKAGLEALTRSAALELGPLGIRVNSICPGLTATMANRDQWDGNPDLWSERSRGIPLGRAGTAEDHAAAALYFASSASAWVTGSCLVIDGGMSAY